jgi:sugar lactone lactonase YvrE
VTSSIVVDALTTVAHGIVRPEDVQVARDGTVYASDAGAAISEIRPDGSMRRIGRAGGEPNGFTLTEDGAAIIANFALGRLQRLDLASGRVDTVLDRVDGRELGSVNYPLSDRSGAIWVSTSTARDPINALATGDADGFIFRVDPDGSAHVVADQVAWPNCMTFDDDEQRLYVCRSAHADVVRFPRVGADQLGQAERYGPPVGQRRSDEFGANQLAAFGDAATLARWGFTDGCAFDADGNLWVTLLSANRIVAITPALEVIVVVDDPEGKIVASPTSIAFAGDDRCDVYIGSLTSNYVVKGRSSVAGRA